MLPGGGYRPPGHHGRRRYPRRLRWDLQRRDSTRTAAPRVWGRGNGAGGDRWPGGGGGLVVAAIQSVRLPGLRAPGFPDHRVFTYLAFRGLNGRRAAQRRCRPGSRTLGRVRDRAGESPALEIGGGGDQHALQGQHVMAVRQAERGGVESVADRAVVVGGERGDRIAVDGELDRVPGQEAGAGHRRRGALRDIAGRQAYVALELAEFASGLLARGNHQIVVLGGCDQGRDELARIDRAPAAGHVETGACGEAGYEHVTGGRVDHRVVPADHVGDSGGRPLRAEHVVEHGVDRADVV